MSELQELFNYHARKVAISQKWYTEDGAPTLKAWVRAEQLVRLDFLLNLHRKEHGTLWEPLSGNKALTHLLFVKTGWSPEQISLLSFEEILLVLQQDLVTANIPEGELQYPQHISYDLMQKQRQPYQIEWPPHLADEWDPVRYEIIQGLRKPS